MQSCVDRQVMTPNQEILMRFELHTVTLIPIISQLPPARLACWPHSTSVGAERLLQAAFLLSLKLQHSVGQPLWPPISQASPVTDRELLHWWCHAQTQSPQGGTCCETSAEVSGEIQLFSGQSLIDNGLWQPALRTTSSSLDPWMVF